MKKTFSKQILFLLVFLAAAACQPRQPGQTPDPISDTTSIAPISVVTAVPTWTPAARPESTPTNAILSALANQAKHTPEAGNQNTPVAESAIPTQPVKAIPEMYGWWNDTVFYEVFVRSFKDSDGNGIGDLQGLIEKLDYLNDGDPETTSDLGITGIWLMPVTESTSYHGYDVVDYFAVDSEYGSQEDFKRLIDEAHQRGIKVIIDLVINHTGIENPWFKASQAGDPEFRDWYIWQNTRPSFPGPSGQNVWHFSNGAYYYALFWGGMPDLNLENPEVTDKIFEITRFWLEEMNVDGFRMDAIRHLIENGAVQENTLETHAWLQGFHQFYKSVDSLAFTVGEAWTTTDQVLDYIGDEMDIAFEFDLAQAFVNAAQGPIVAGLKKQAQKVLDSYPTGQYGIFLTNHDQNRVGFDLASDSKAKLAATLLLTFPGVPFIYYGEEIGMIGRKPDEDIRLPMQWTGEAGGAGFSSGTPWRPPYPDYATRNVAAEAADPASLWNHYRELISLRNQYPELRTGESVLVETNTARLYAMLRYSDDQAFLVLVNPYPKDLNTENYALSLPKSPFSGAITAEAVLGEAGLGEAGLDNPLPPEINSRGGFENYHPFDLIPAKSSAIIKLTP